MSTRMALFSPLEAKVGQFIAESDLPEVDLFGAAFGAHLADQARQVVPFPEETFWSGFRLQGVPRSFSNSLRAPKCSLNVCISLPLDQVMWNICWSIVCPGFRTPLLSSI